MSILIGRGIGMSVIKWLGRAWNRSMRKPRDRFLEILPKNSVGAELGVFKGLFTKELLHIVQPAKLHLVDPYWTSYGEHFSWSSDETEQGTLKTRDAYDLAQAIVRGHDRSGVCEFHIEDDLVFLKRIDDAYFDWVYVDTSHTYEHTRLELELLDAKVKQDGLITGHDWREDPAHRDHGVFVAVLEFCKSHDWQVAALDRRRQWCLRRREVRVSATELPLKSIDRGFLIGPPST